MRILAQSFTGNHIRYCDAKCHNAKQGPCTCICEGLLHGHGEAYARANARKAEAHLCCVANLSTTPIYGPSLVKQKRQQEKQMDHRTGNVGDM